MALAGFLTFLLSPLVNRLRQLGLPRTPSVIVAVVFSAAVLGGIGWVVTEQISSLLRELPNYRDRIREKARTIKEVTGGSGRLQEMITDVSKELGRDADGPPRRRGGRGGGAAEGPAGPARPADRRGHRAAAGRLDVSADRRSSARCSSTSASWPWRSSWSSSCC